MIINVEEFAELAGVTTETMRSHLKAIVGAPTWLIERGSQGRPYRIDSDGALAWWKDKRDAEDMAGAERKAQFAQLRFEHLGGAVESEEALVLSGKQRREEYAAVLERIKVRRLMGELVDRGELEASLSHAAVEARQRLAQIPGEYAATMGLSPAEVEPLTNLIERVVNDFVDSLMRSLAESPGA